MKHKKKRHDRYNYRSLSVSGCVLSGVLLEPVPVWTQLDCYDIMVVRSLFRKQIWKSLHFCICIATIFSLPLAACSHTGGCPVNQLINQAGVRVQHDGRAHGSRHALQLCRWSRPSHAPGVGNSRLESGTWDEIALTPTVLAVHRLVCRGARWTRTIYTILAGAVRYIRHPQYSSFAVTCERASVVG